ncbi:MFS transporter [Helicobacter sp. faydin-H20]|uniref:MFS transporter n=1 Tax=Helicobacter anatolicus TaxID=2905874 RepID=UPI001E50D333|nr:MFS transporter [Helicobacter anatolicus]MCE3036386.1 MFS transporter [Helicobacter anatolicus]
MVNILAWLNFFIADIRDGFGPYLGVFLKELGLGEGQIGLFSTIANLIALSLAIPFGMLIDKTKSLRTWIGICIFGIMSALLLSFFLPSLKSAFLAQLAIALGGAFLAPAFLALTLGVVGQTHLPSQFARNEAYRHFGAVVASLVCFFGALYFGMGSIFGIMVVFSSIALILLALLRHTESNSAKPYISDHKNNTKTSSKNLKSFEVEKSHILKVLLDSRVLFMGVVLFLFHLSNAAMLPLLSQKAHAMGVDSTGAYAAITIVIAQSVMIVVSFWCGKYLNTSTHLWRSLMAICFFELILRGILAACFHGVIAMIFIQILDGIGAGISGVLAPVLLAHLLSKNTRMATGVSASLAMGGVGGALSSSLGGILAEHFGYFYAYTTLGIVAFLGLIVWWFGSRVFLKE